MCADSSRAGLFIGLLYSFCVFLFIVYIFFLGMSVTSVVVKSNVIFLSQNITFLKNEFLVFQRKCIELNCIEFVQKVTIS